MAVLESLLHLSLVLLAAGGGAAPDPTEAAADLRVPILSSSVAADNSGDLADVARWQQTEDVPSDLPDETEPADSPPIEQVDPGDAEPLDAPLVEDEPLDADLGDVELLEADLAADEPLDAPLDEEAAAPILEATDPPPSAPAPPAHAAVAAPKHDSKRTPALPADFGRGVTIVRNPTGGNTAEVPTDCKQVLEHGRAVIGIGCGDDDGPWWLSQVGQSAPAAHAAPTEQRSETAVSPPRQDRAVIVSPSRADDDDLGDGETIGYSTVTVGDETVRVPNVSNVERITIDRSGGREVVSDRGGDGNREVARARGGRVTGLDQVSSAQAAKQSGKKSEAKKPNAKNAKQGTAKPKQATAKKSPCVVVKQLAKAGMDKKHLAKHRAKCKQHKKAAARERAESRMIHSLLG